VNLFLIAACCSHREQQVFLHTDNAGSGNVTAGKIKVTAALLMPQK
jgi:hypothetical protein